MRNPVPVVFLISATAIGYEILLMRLLQIIQWHHFVSMIISLALLGYGASGTFVCLCRKPLLARFHLSLAANAAAFGLTMGGSFILAQRLPFNPLEILWQPGQFFYLLGVYGILFVPFFFASNCVCLALVRFEHAIHHLYRFDLLGAGTGALFIIFLLYLLPPQRCLTVLCLSGFLAAGMSCFMALRGRLGLLAALTVFAGGIVLVTWLGARFSPEMSPYKPLQRALQVQDTAIIGRYHSPLGSLSVVRSPTIPFRYAPGLSLNCELEPPPQLGIFNDGDAMTPLTRFDGRLPPLAYLDGLSSALPYHLLSCPTVLILGAGGGTDILAALYHGARRIHAVELNPQMVDLIKRVHGDFTAQVFDSEHIRFHVADARGFLAGANAHYDLIQMSLLDSFSASVSGAGAATTSPLYTVEAVKSAFERLNPGGYLAITRWLKIPPRDALKLFLTAVTVLEMAENTHARTHLALIRSWKTTTLLVKRGGLNNRDVASIRDFCRKRSFDLIYYPGIREDETNRFNLMQKPDFYRGALALLGKGRKDFLRRYKFNLSPATDDRPYFFHFFKWTSLREILSLKGQGGLSLLELGHPLLVATLLQAFFLSLAFVLLPLLPLKRSSGKTARVWSMGAGFVCLGLAFLVVEIAFIQKLMLFLHHPIHAMAAVLASFLVFAGLGSG